MPLETDKTPTLRGSHADMNRQADIAEVRTYALKLLSYRSRSKKEMIERLRRKGFDNRQINSAMEYLENAGLINDEVLASELFRHSVEKKSLGGKGVRMFLTRRGIDKELIDKTLSALTTDMEERTALKFIEKKLKTQKKYPEDVIRRRLWGMLQRRGFPSDVINKAVNSIKLLS